MFVETKLKIESETITIRTYQTGIFDFCTYIQGEKNAFSNTTDEEQALKSHNRALLKVLRKKREEYMNQSMLKRVR